MSIHSFIHSFIHSQQSIKFSSFLHDALAFSFCQFVEGSHPKDFGMNWASDRSQVSSFWSQPDFVESHGHFRPQRASKFVSQRQVL